MSCAASSSPSACGNTASGSNASGIGSVTANVATCPATVSSAKTKSFLNVCARVGEDAAGERVAEPRDARAVEGRAAVALEAQLLAVGDRAGVDDAEARVEVDDHRLDRAIADADDAHRRGNRLEAAAEDVEAVAVAAVDGSESCWRSGFSSSASRSVFGTTSVAAGVEPGGSGRTTRIRSLAVRDVPVEVVGVDDRLERELEVRRARAEQCAHGPVSGAVELDHGLDRAAEQVELGRIRDELAERRREPRLHRAPGRRRPLATQETRRARVRADRCSFADRRVLSSGGGGVVGERRAHGAQRVEPEPGDVEILRLQVVERGEEEDVPLLVGVAERVRPAHPAELHRLDVELAWPSAVDDVDEELARVVDLEVPREAAEDRQRAGGRGAHDVTLAGFTWTLRIHACWSGVGVNSGLSRVMRRPSSRNSAAYESALTEYVSVSGTAPSSVAVLIAPPPREQRLEASARRRRGSSRSPSRAVRASPGRAARPRRRRRARSARRAAARRGSPPGGAAACPAGPAAGSAARSSRRSAGRCRARRRTRRRRRRSPRRAGCRRRCRRRRALRRTR